MEFNATFLVSAISFIIFTLIMNKLLYQPISDIILKRQAYIDANTKAAENNFESAASINEEKERKLQSSRLDAKKQVMAEVENSKLIKKEHEMQKKSELAASIEQHKNELSKECEQLAGEINGKVDELSASIIAKLTGGEL